MLGLKIVHIISGLKVGGAETALYQLLTSQQFARTQSLVINLGQDGPIGEKIRQSGLVVRDLGINPALPNPLKLFTLRRWLMDVEPDIVHTWMYHANLIAGAVAKLSTDARLLWAVRQDIRDKSWIKPTTRWVIKMGGRLAGAIPDRILSVSERAVSSHVQIGYPREKFLVISNGLDTNIFLPNPGARKSVLEELGLEESVQLLGFFARDHPIKDHRTFLRAAQLAHKRLPSLHFVLCGNGMDKSNRKLISEIEKTGLRKVVHLLGLREDMPRLYAALDIYSISSVSEGFPSSVGEAMASAVPCVVTDVGDAAKLVGDTGIVVPSRSPEGLANAWAELLEYDEVRKLALSQAARDRIIENFSFEKMLNDYYRIYAELAN